MMQTRLTPAQAWEGFVGSQTPQEFMELSRQKGESNIEWAVADYVKDIPAMFGQPYTEDELLDIAAALATFIREKGSEE